MCDFGRAGVGRISRNRELMVRIGHGPSTSERCARSPGESLLELFFGIVLLRVRGRRQILVSDGAVLRSSSFSPSSLWVAWADKGLR